MSIQFYFKQLFSISTQFSFGWFIDRTLSDTTTPGKSRPGSDGNECVLRIPQSSNITANTLSDCLVSYLGHTLPGSYFYAKKQSVNFTAPADLASFIFHSWSSAPDLRTEMVIYIHDGWSSLYTRENKTSYLLFLPTKGIDQLIMIKQWGQE